MAIVALRSHAHVKRSFIDQRFFLLGQSYSGGVVALAGTLFFASLLTALIARLAPGIAGLVPLVATRVLGGEVWRLLTWAFFEFDPFGLVFGCWAILMFGGALSTAWTTRRFVLRALALIAGTAALTTLISLAWTSIRLYPFAGPWPLIAGLTVAWGLTFPKQQLLAYLVIPVQGKSMAGLTLLLTAITGILRGAETVLPHLCAIALVLFYFRGLPALTERLRPRRRPNIRLVEPQQGSGPRQWVH